MLKKAFYYLFTFPIYKLAFARFGGRSWLVNARVDGFSRIRIGSGVYMNNGGWLACIPLEKTAPASLDIGDGCYFGRFCHIYATRKISIGRKVLVADKVYLADNMHRYDNVNLPVIDQPVEQMADVIIGDGAWLGENVCVIGARVGRQSVVAANAVVLSDIPDFCVAAGAPARIVKRYSEEKKAWLKTNEKGEFLA